jgi:hypothetical protein
VTRQGRAYFFGAAARAMRQVLIEAARRRNAIKRGGGVAPVTLGDDHVGVDAYASELLDLDRALTELERRSHRQARVVECRYFGGLSVEETAAALDVSPRTVKSDWALARAWLYTALRDAPEARAASALDHPNLATVYEIGEGDDGRLFIAMAWYEGGTLRERLAAGPLPVAEACAIAAQLAEGLAAAHRRGVYHRDVKPENIAFGRGDRPVVVDFGVASAVRRQRGAPRLAGTVAYMSPEQSRAEPVDGTTDVWSLGRRALRDARRPPAVRWIGAAAYLARAWPMSRSSRSLLVERYLLPAWTYGGRGPSPRPDSPRSWPRRTSGVARGASGGSVAGPAPCRLFTCPRAGRPGGRRLRGPWAGGWPASPPRGVPRVTEARGAAGDAFPERGWVVIADFEATPRTRRHRVLAAREALAVDLHQSGFVNVPSRRVDDPAPADGRARHARGSTSRWRSRSPSGPAPARC